MMLVEQHDSSWNEALERSVSSEIAGACAESGCGIEDEQQVEVARAVASLASRQHPVSTGYLVLLAARALWSVGAENAARRLVEDRRGELSFEPACADAAFVPDIPLARWWAVVSLKAVRPSKVFDSVSGGTWVLDLSRVVRPGGEGLELALFRLIGVILDDMAPLWDATRGCGILGLQHVGSAASSVLKRGRSSRKTLALSSEIMKICSAKLAALRDARGWTDHPRVLRLDWQR